MTSTPERSVEQRLDLIESRNAINDLISSYAHGMDKRDIDRFMSIWHEGAEYLLGDPFEYFYGLDEILRACTEVIWGGCPDTWHITTNRLITIDGDAATGMADVDCAGTDASGRPILIGASYFDEYERREGRWGIVRRRADIHYLTGLLEGWGLTPESKMRPA